jgi:hypothetical protein
MNIAGEPLLDEPIGSEVLVIECGLQFGNEF